MVSPVKLWRNQKKIQQHLGSKGVITSWTIVRAAPSGYEAQAPYPVIVVSLGKKENLTGQLVDWNVSHLRIGQKVEAVLRRVYQPDPAGAIPYGIKFRPL